MAEQAIEQYKKCCKRDPKNINSVKGIAYLYLQMKKFDEAKEYYKKASSSILTILNRTTRSL